MTSRRAYLVLSLLVLSALSAGTARAQTPLGPPRTDLASNEGANVLESLAVDGQGNVTLLWGEARGRRTFGRRFSAADTPLGAGFQVSRFTTFPRVAANERGDTVIIWNQGSQGGGDEVLVRRLRPGLPQLTIRADRGRGAALRIAGDVDVDRNGRFVAVWTEAMDSGGRLHAQRFNADGTYQGPEITLNAPGAEVQVEPRVAMNPATGDFMVLWMALGFGQADRILAQRFSFRSGALGRPFQVNSTPPGEFSFPEVGCAADGSCVVVWRRYRGTNRPGDVVFQRFGPDGKRRGGETLVARTPAVSHPASLAVAPQGYFVVAWTSTGLRPRFRLFRGDGTPAGPEMEITETEFPSSPELAFGWDGTFVLGWTNFLGTIEDRTWQVNYQRFAVPPGL